MRLDALGANLNSSPAVEGAPVQIVRRMWPLLFQVSARVARGCNAGNESRFRPMLVKERRLRSPGLLDSDRWVTGQGRRVPVLVHVSKDSLNGKRQVLFR